MFSKYKRDLKFSERKRDSCGKSEYNASLFLKSKQTNKQNLYTPRAILTSEPKTKQRQWGGEHIGLIMMVHLAMRIKHTECYIPGSVEQMLSL